MATDHLCKTCKHGLFYTVSSEASSTATSNLLCLLQGKGIKELTTLGKGIGPTHVISECTRYEPNQDNP